MMHGQKIINDRQCMYYVTTWRACVTLVTFDLTV